MSNLHFFNYNENQALIYNKLIKSIFLQQNPVFLLTSKLYTLEYQV